MSVNTFLQNRPVRRWVLAAVFAGANNGCSWDEFTLVKPPTAPPPPVDGFVIRAEGITPEKLPAENSPQAQLAGAHELFRKEEYEKAEQLYHHLAEKKNISPSIVQEARFYEAESLRMQARFPKAADTYADLMKKFHNNPYREQCNQRMFDIATFWLEDTWAQMKEREEKRRGERWVVWPRYVSFEKKEPVLDREGRALELLDQVRFNDMNGPLADKALWLAGLVKMENEDFREAEQYFTQLHEHHGKSPFAPRAVELAIFCKQMATGGSDYDGRKVAEARKLVDVALRMPEMDEKKKQALVQQLKSITAQQAEKDYKTAEFYRRTGHPGPAYFCYDIVRRRYPGTEFAEKAAQKMVEMRAALEKKGGEEHRDPVSAGPDAPRRFPGVNELAPPPRSLPSGLDR
jgi:outer membrane protein assembly factor BamD (BamD/ComL family)